VVAVAAPDPGRRDRLGDRHGLATHARFADWRDLLAHADRLDGIVVATPDAHHVEPAIAALEAGTDVLVEKPIDPTPEGVRRLRAAARGATATVTVAHVLRYTPFFQTIRRLLDEGSIGELVTIEHTENIGYWHFAHSYVRGNWRRTDETSPMILAKACHDLDLLRWFAGGPCTQVASFGGLFHFRAEQAPEGAPDHCLDGCPVEDRCPFHAGRFYVDALAGWHGPPVTLVTADATPEGRLDALRRGPYGRCVYRCDNDAADHQVVACEFAAGMTATLTVSAFTEETTREVRFHGTRGELRGHLDRGRIEVRRFLPAPAVARPSGATGVAGPAAAGTDRTVLDVGQPDLGSTAPPAGAFLGHAGGDAGLMRDFVRRLRLRRAGQVPDEALTSLEESLDSHEMAFAAEQARRSGQVVQLGARQPAVAWRHAGGDSARTLQAREGT
jgi:predicted dehydrogenase